VETRIGFIGLEEAFNRVNGGKLWEALDKRGYPKHLWHYATSRKVTGWIPYEDIRVFQSTQSFQPHYGSLVDSASNRNEYQESSGRKGDNLTAIFEPIV
jgi:hypothetical protein